MREKRSPLISISVLFFVPLLVNIASSIITSSDARTELVSVVPWRVLLSPIPLWGAIVGYVVALSVLFIMFIKTRTTQQESALLAPIDREISQNDWMNERLRQIKKEVTSGMAKGVRISDEPVIPRVFFDYSLATLNAEEEFFYALTGEVSERMRGAFVASRSAKVSEDDAKSQFDEAFQAGRLFAPYDGRGRVRVIWLAGMLGQLQLDLAHTSRKCVKMPAALADDEALHPGLSRDLLYDNWNERSKGEVNREIADAYSGREIKWAREILDDLISSFDVEDEARES